MCNEAGVLRIGGRANQEAESMSSVNGVGGSTNTYQAEQQSTSGTVSSSAATVSKDQFLKLFVAQLKNQDPVNPINNEQFITQLATFSSLEQLMSINQAVTKLAGLADGATASQTGSSTKAVE
jgi:flagellar basal-body rod modification protein FlgD